MKDKSFVWIGRSFLKNIKSNNITNRETALCIAEKSFKPDDILAEGSSAVPPLSLETIYIFWAIKTLLPVPAFEAE